MPLGDLVNCLKAQRPQEMPLGRAQRGLVGRALKKPAGLVGGWGGVACSLC